MTVMKMPPGPTRSLERPSKGSAGTAFWVGVQRAMFGREVLPVAGFPVILAGTEIPSP